MMTSSGMFVFNVSGAVVFFMITVFGTMSFAQKNPAGFLSIDCGGAQSVDPQTNLLWVADGRYVVTGRNGRVQDPNLVNSTIDNYQALQTFRYFSDEEMRSKYCYELPMDTDNVSFILRATFLHGNASELRLPIEFDVYVNATPWTTVKYTEGDDLYDPVVQESIFFSPLGGNITNVCLIPKKGLGIPFISSLERRLLDQQGIMYSSAFFGRTGGSFYYSNILRWNTGASSKSTVRYPDDDYDRFWRYPSQDWNLQRIESQKAQFTIGAGLNYVPSKVMQDAWSRNETQYFHLDLPNMTPGTSSYGLFYFAILDDSTIRMDNPTTLYMSFDTIESQGFNITDEASGQTFFYVLSANFTSVVIYGSFVLNAMEFYREDRFLPSTTYELDVAAADSIKEVLNMTDWQGDPCTPEPYNWIGCGLNSYQASQWYITSMTLSHEQHISRLTTLNRTELWVLFDLSIQNSNIDFNLFTSLLKDFVNATDLSSLDLSFNNIDTFPDGQWWKILSNGSVYSLSSLDFSYNQLSQVPRFIDIPFSNQTQYLSIAHNNITGEFPDATDFSNLTSLRELNLSSNHLQGKIPWSLSSQNLPSLEVLDISNNSFSGDFPSNFYFVNGGMPFKLYAADNKFTGVLNLTTWYQNLKAASEANSTFGRMKTSTKFNQIFSLLNNDISSIEPSIEDFQPVVESLISREDFNQSGILLGGNPYCKHAKHFTQRYLCRSSIEDPVNPDVKEKSKKAIIVVSVVGGSFLLLCFIFFTLVIWRLSKKIYVLKLVEQELAHRKVQPPYYSYHDLKVATRNFHNDNHLGRGTFGAVYKGVLSDGTTIAVKRLFNSESNNKKQVLNDFLNEVVLITGIKHRNLIQLKGCCIENQERILVYEYAERDNVESALWGEDYKTRLSWKNRFKICVGIASGLTYLHEELQPRIIHRDIKPGNVLLDKNLNPKIADFGLAKPILEEVDVHVTQVISGTRGYFAPEYISEGLLTTKVDTFSFGVLVLEIVSGRKCFDQRLPPEQVQLRSWAQKLQKSGSTLKLLDPAIKSDYSEPEVLKVINIALMCVQNDPELRPTMSEVETMLLEGKERMYDILCTAKLRKEENMLSLEKLYSNLKVGMGADTISSLFPGRGSQSSATASSSTQLEEKPLLYGQHKSSGSETSGEFSSSDTREGYYRALGSMQRSLSERVKRETF